MDKPHSSTVDDHMAAVEAGKHAKPPAPKKAAAPEPEKDDSKKDDPKSKK